MIAPIGMHGNALRISPPLCINGAEVDAACDILESALPA